jgi:hypothetical protein
MSRLRGKSCADGGTETSPSRRAFESAGGLLVSLQSGTSSSRRLSALARPVCSFASAFIDANRAGSTAFSDQTRTYERAHNFSTPSGLWPLRTMLVECCRCWLITNSKGRERPRGPLVFHIVERDVPRSRNLHLPRMHDISSRSPCLLSVRTHTPPGPHTPIIAISPPPTLSIRSQAIAAVTHSNDTVRSGLSELGPLSLFLDRPHPLSAASIGRGTETAEGQAASSSPLPPLPRREGIMFETPSFRGNSIPTRLRTGSFPGRLNTARVGSRVLDIDGVSTSQSLQTFSEI